MKRWWGIRHIRYWWLGYKVDRFVAKCRRYGLGIAISPPDADHLADVWAGRA